MKFLLKSPYSCLVKTKSSECELDANDTLEIENEPAIFVYPLEKDILPFSVDLISRKDCEKYSFFSRAEKNFLILENSPKFSLKTKEKLNFPGKIVEICVGNKTVSFSTADKEIECICETRPQDFSCFKIKNFACVQFENELFLFSVTEAKVYHFVGEIEVEGNRISVTKHFPDSERREKKSVFRVEDEIEVEEEFFCTTAQKTEENLQGLAPFKLMESVCAKDYSHALTFLSEKLKNQIDSTQIKNFFGNFSAFLPVSTTEFITLNGSKKNFVQFSLYNNLIDDIIVDDL